MIAGLAEARSIVNHIAATGRGPHCRFGGPVSELGWLVARAVKTAMDAGVARWMKEHR